MVTSETVAELMNPFTDSVAILLKELYRLLRDKSIAAASLVMVLSFVTIFKLEIRESHHLVKDFGGTARS